MAGKHIDLDMPVFEVVSAFPEVKEIVAELGFGEIDKPGMLQAMGRIMTQRKGSHARGVTLGTVVAVPQERGFAVAGYETPEPEVLEEQPAPPIPFAYSIRRSTMMPGSTSARPKSSSALPACSPSSIPKLDEILADGQR